MLDGIASLHSDNIGMWQRIVTFMIEARQEFRRVSWPTRREAMYLTSVVIGLSLVLALLLGLFDYLFLTFVKFLILP